MYRNICHFTRSGSTHCLIDSWDETGKPISIVEEVKPRLFYESPYGKVKTMFSTVALEKTFSSVRDRSVWIAQHPGVRLFECMTPSKQFLLDRFIGQERTDDFQKYDLLIYTLDIELAVSDGDKFPEPDLAERPVNLITVHDSKTDEYHIWFMPPSGQKIDIPTDKPNRHYYRFESETRLLANFFYWWRDHRPDMLTGWNISAFDMPYLINRARRVLGTLFEVEKCLSPIGNIYFMDDGNLMKKIAKVAGLSIIDYFYIYKFKFERAKPKYGLGDVLADELDTGKLDHSEFANFYQFYTQNFSKFMEYNIMDVEGVVLLERKKHLLMLVRKICNLALVEYESIYYTKPYVQGGITIQAKMEGKLFLSESGEEESTESFRGAFVYETQTGFYNRGGWIFDLNSLYPMAMIQINCSPETKVGKIVGHYGDKIDMSFANGKTATINQAQLDKILTEKCCISENQILYIKPEIQKGIMPKFLEFLYAERKRIKKEGIEYEKRAITLKDEDAVKHIEEIKALMVKSQICNITQEAYKIMLNSVYGILGLRHYCCFDVDNAEAVTQTGQAVIKQSALVVADIYKRKYQYTDNAIIAGDTDSLMGDASPAINQLFGLDKVEWNKKNTHTICKELDGIADELNTRIQDWAIGHFHSKLRKFEFKREAFFDRATFLKKKHYVMRIVDKEGKYLLGSGREWKYTGVDIKRNQIPMPVKKMLKHAVETMMIEEWKDAQFRECMQTFWEEFQKLAVEDIAYQFAYKTSKQAAGFLAMEPHTHISAKVATFYNQMLEHLKLTDYERIGLGDVAKYVYLKPDNQFHLEVMGFKDNWPKEFAAMFEINHRLMFDKIVADKLEGFREVFGFHTFDCRNIEEVDIFNL